MEFLLNPAALGDVLASSVRLGIPIAFAALGGVFAERSGTYNIGLEGMILAGALGAAAGSFMTGSPLVGLGAGIICGVFSGLLLGVMAIHYKVNQLVAGIAINLLLVGLTAFLSRLIFGDMAGGARVEGFGTINLAFLSEIPIIGPALFSQDPLFYLLIALAVGGWFWLFRTNSGLDLRAVGENPRAADVAGVPVFPFRYTAIAVSGAIAALGGVHLVLSQVYLFAEGMSAGKGFIALAAIILGRWSPVGAVLAAFFFGFCDAMQLRLQFSNPDVPYQAFLIIPYVASLVALVGFVGKVRAPAAVGLEYDREKR
ncbi:ABC transporter permease [Roseibium sp. SCP14]|uniref:ABC transporter permease n=1 Tax=Roseibium sp. SCP14 TaxID=3141375 RepID=UPI00333A71A2